MSITVLIADDQELLRTGFRMILHTQDDIKVTGEAADGDQAVRLARELRPDVVLMDIRMPATDGITATRQLAGPGTARPTRVIILTTYDLDEYVFDALAAGASGFLLKDAPPEDLIQAVRHVAAGDALLAPRVTRRLIAQFARCRPARISQPAADMLTPRELEVLALVATGQSNTEIAASLHVSDNTVKTHLTHILDKLGLRDRVHAVVYAYETGIIEPRSTGH
jgi:DNA-binding NarL/FixJ family response regulator